MQFKAGVMMNDKKLNRSANNLSDAETERNLGKQGDLICFFKELVFLLSIVLLIFAFLVRIVVVSGASMNDTLLHGDYVVLLGNLLYTKPKAGDVVVISKESFEDGEPIIKRVIATEGQIVDIDFDKGIVYVNGQPLDEPYVNTPTNLYEGIHFPLSVDEGCLFVMGDNRNFSKDSRSPEIGLVDCREVVGKAWILIFPGRAENSFSRDFGRIGVIS